MDGREGPEISDYRTEDHERVERLWTLCGVDARAGDDAENLRRINDREPGLFVVARQADDIVGTVLATFDGRRGWITHLCVAPEHRNGGLASRLLATAEQRLVDRGCPQINLLIHPQNEYGLGAFYAKRGYAKRNLVFMSKEGHAPDTSAS